MKKVCSLNPNWHELWKQEKCSYLAQPRGTFYKTQWASKCVKLNPIDFNFHFQKSLEIFDKNSADEIWSKNPKEIKVSPLMPIRVKIFFWFTLVEVFFLKTRIFQEYYLKIKICYSLFGKKITSMQQAVDFSLILKNLRLGAHHFFFEEEKLLTHKKGSYNVHIVSNVS